MRIPDHFDGYDGPVCQRCHRERPVDDLERCDDCATSVAEEAAEQDVADFHGGSGPTTIDEQVEAAWQEKRRLDSPLFALGVDLMRGGRS